MYAQNTSVPVSKSKNDIDKTLLKYGAEVRAVLEQPGRAVVVFERDARRVQIVLTLPHAAEFKMKRSGEPDVKAHEQACRSRWRALLLVLHAKLEAVESGITTFEDEFLAHIVMPGGGTVGDLVRPRIEASYKAGKMLALLPGGVG